MSSFQKNFIQIFLILSWNKCILVTLWVKVFVLQGKLQYMHFNSVLIT